MRGYSFKRWSRDIMVWSIYSDLDASRKAAAIVMALQDSAGEFATTIPGPALVQGGMVNGVHVDPMTFLMHALTEKYGQMAEEQRLMVMVALENFTDCVENPQKNACTVSRGSFKKRTITVK